MYLYGVGNSGQDITVNGDFTIHLKSGMYYLNNESGRENIFLCGEFNSRPRNYKKGSFSVSESTEFKSNWAFSVHNELNVRDVFGNKRFSDVLKRISDNTQNITFTANVFGSSRSWGNDFVKKYKVIKDTKDIKVGYFTQGYLVKTLHYILVFTRHKAYLAKIEYNGINPASEEREILSTANSIEAVYQAEEIVNEYESIENESVLDESVFDKKFEKLKYTKGTKVSVGSLIVQVPDEMNYITQNKDSGAGTNEFGLRNTYELVIASKGYDNSLLNHQDMPFGMNIRNVNVDNTVKLLWKGNEAEIKKSVTATYDSIAEVTSRGYKIKVAKLEKNLCIVYSIKGESDNKSEYWISYGAFIVHNNSAYILNICFNSLKAAKTEYEKTTLDFLSKIKAASAKETKEYETQKRIEALGDLADENGKLNAVMVTRLFSEDVLFFNEGEVVQGRSKKEMKGMQINAQSPLANKIIEIKNILIPEIQELAVLLEQNKKLKITDSKINKEVLKGCWNMSISGLSLFEFCAWHMIKVIEKDVDSYLVTFDQDLFYGIPKAYSYIGEILCTLRKYNDRNGDFTVTVISIKNFDSPIENEIQDPVKDADSMMSIYTYKISEGTDPIDDGYEELPMDVNLDEEFDYAENDDSLTRTVENRYTQSSISGLENQLNMTINSWQHEIESTNRSILGSEPIRRSNDARKKKLVSNTEKIINSTAEEIEKIMDNLDSIAADMDEEDNKLPDVIQLIGKCFEALHLKYELVFTRSSKQMIKYSIPKKYQSISSKWKRKYKGLPQVKKEELEETISTTKKEITSIKRRITRNNKKLDEIKAWFEEEGKNIDSEINKCDDLILSYNENIQEKDQYIAENEQKVDEIDKNVSELQKEYSQLEERSKELEKQWKLKNDALKKNYDSTVLEHQRLNDQLSYLNDSKKRISVELSQLRQDEIQKRGEAEKAFLFKKRKIQEADAISFTIQSRTSEINRIETEITNTIQSLQQLDNNYNQSKEFIENSLAEMKSEMQENYNSTDSKMNEINKLSEERNEHKNKILEAIEEKNSIDEKLFLTEERKKELSWNNEEKTRARELITGEIEKDTAAQAELEEKVASMKEELASIG